MTQQPSQPGTDLIGEFQRWLFRSGARGVSREMGGQFRTAFGRGGPSSGDVWQSATTLPHDEAPECAWCPVCRAARRLNESGPGMASHVAAASDALSTVVADAMSVFESAMAGTRPRASGEADTPPGEADTPPGAADTPSAGRGVWEEAAASPAASEGPPREPDDRG